jgi:hypothetical protein
VEPVQAPFTPTGARKSCRKKWKEAFVKSFFLTLTLLLAVLFSNGVGVASAASFNQTNAITAAVSDDGAIVKVQGYGGGGGYEGGSRRRGGYDDDNDNDRGRRYRDHESRREYCWKCRKRCDDGWCPPRCWGWRNACRWDR